MSGIQDVMSAVSRWAAEADLSQPVSDGQIELLASPADAVAVREALRLSRAWRIALAAGDGDRLNAVLNEAAAFHA